MIILKGLKELSAVQQMSARAGSAASQIRTSPIRMGTIKMVYIHTIGALIITPFMLSGEAPSQTSAGIAVRALSRAPRVLLRACKRALGTSTVTSDHTNSAYVRHSFECNMWQQIEDLTEEQARTSLVHEQLK